MSQLALRDCEQISADRSISIESAAESEHLTWRVAFRSPLGEAYDEPTFRHLLAIERKRAERSNRPFLLLLVDLKKNPDFMDGNDRFSIAAAGLLFTGLWQCLRETDFTGWYSESRVIGAALTQFTDKADAAGARAIALRIRQELAGRLPSALNSRLQVRIYQLPSKARA
jgi:hypothetical protein